MPDIVMSPVRHRARILTVRLVFLLYGLLLAEGPLRKWVMPGASNALVFIRDPIMLLILLAYARVGISAPMRRLVRVFGLVLLVFLFGILCQLATSAVPPLAILAGIRNYFLFVPLCWILHDTFTREDYADWIKLNLILAVPVAALVVVQYRAGPTAWVNAVPGGGNDGVFLVVEDVVRPYGLFSFTLGHSTFAAWMVGVAFAAVSARSALRIRPGLLLAGNTGIGLMGACSGSRTFLLLAGSGLAVFLIGAFALGARLERKLAGLIVASLAVALVGLFLAAPSVVSDLVDRQSAAVASEGATTERVTRVLTDFTEEMGRVPAFGFGLGSGTNVANFLSNGRTDHVLAEYELTRIVQELGPYFGLFAILLRWSLVALFTVAALRAVRLRRNLQPLCYLGFVAPLFLAHDVTLQNSMIGMAWFAAGIFLSALRVGPPCMAADPEGAGQRSALHFGAAPCA